MVECGPPLLSEVDRSINQSIKERKKEKRIAACGITFSLEVKDQAVELVRKCFVVGHLGVVGDCTYFLIIQYVTDELTQGGNDLCVKATRILLRNRNLETIEFGLQFLKQ